MSGQFSTIKETSNLFAPSKSCEKHLWKSYILGKDTSHWYKAYPKQ